MLLEIIGAVLILFMLQTMIPTVFQYLGGDGAFGSKLLVALGPRDNPPPMPAMAGRAQRALFNMFEALVVFIPLAVLAIVLNKDGGMVLTGAVTFLGARIAYVPAYLWGLPGLRSLVWGIGTAGLVMMAMGVFG